MQHSSKWQTSIPNRLANLMRAIEELDRYLESWGANEQARHIAQLAVEELGTNIIKYGYDDRNEHVINLRAVNEEHFFRLCLEDDGHEFNPCLTPEPNAELSLEERTPGGWGLSLVRKMVASMAYERRDGRNILCFTVSHDSRPPIA